ncbi:hypothetical protein V2J09_010962 [Rumex salicifolius]
MGRIKHTAQRTPATKNRQSGPAESAAGNRTRKPTRFKPGTVALREIRRYQKTTELLIPAAPFIRTVKELTNHFSQSVTRWEAEALVALQEVAEDFVVSMFRDAMLCAFHAKRGMVYVTQSTGPISGKFDMHVNTLPGLPDLRVLGSRMRQDLQLARRLGGLGKPW